MQTAELTSLIFLGSERTREGSGAGRQSCVSLPWQRHTSRLRAASHVIMCSSVRHRPPVMAQDFSPSRGCGVGLWPFNSIPRRGRETDGERGRNVPSPIPACRPNSMRAADGYDSVRRRMVAAAHHQCPPATASSRNELAGRSQFVTAARRRRLRLRLGRSRGALTDSGRRRRCPAPIFLVHVHDQPNSTVFH